MTTKEDFIEITFSQLNETDTDILVALLTAAGFEGFDESGNELKAYISKEAFNEPTVKEIAEPYSLSYQTKEIASQNWNAVWESNFEPVVIDDFVAVRAHFHQPIAGVQYEIVITPKMSFGTGHHATTTMMIQQMRNLDFTDKTVFDFGTGTGILSILAEKSSAKKILAVDNDMWSIENSKENIEKNNCNKIDLELRDDANTSGSFDIILANINRNVILDNIDSLYSQIKEGGYLLLSGLLAEDENDILDKTNQYQLLHINTLHRLQWISLLFSR